MANEAVGNRGTADVGAVERAWPPSPRKARGWGGGRTAQVAASGSAARAGRHPPPPASAHARPSSGCWFRLQVAPGWRTGGGASGSLCAALCGAGGRRGLSWSWSCCRRPADHSLPRQRAVLLRWLPLPVLWQPRPPQVRRKVKRSPICGSSISSPSWNGGTWTSPESRLCSFPDSSRWGPARSGKASLGRASEPPLPPQPPSARSRRGPRGGEVGRSRAAPARAGGRGPSRGAPAPARRAWPARGPRAARDRPPQPSTPASPGTSLPGCGRPARPPKGDRGDPGGARSPAFSDGERVHFLAS